MIVQSILIYDTSKNNISSNYNSNSMAGISAELRAEIKAQFFEGSTKMKISKTFRADKH